MHIEQGARAEPAMVRLNYEPRSRRFDATMRFRWRLASRQAPLRLSGVVHRDLRGRQRWHARSHKAKPIKTSDLVIERRPRADFVPAMVSSIRAGRWPGRSARAASRQSHPPVRSDETRIGRPQ